MGQTGYWSALTSIGTPTFSAADGLTRFTSTAQAAPFAELGQSVGAGMVPWQARRIYALTVTASGPGIQGRLKLFDGTTTTRWTTAWIGSGETALVTTGATVNPKFHQLALMAPPTTTGWIRWSVVDRGPAP